MNQDVASAFPLLAVAPLQRLEQDLDLDVT